MSSAVDSLTSWAPVLREYDPLLSGSIDGTPQDPHDRAILRALNAKYRPNKRVVGDAERTVFVARLNPATTEESLRGFFSECGRVARVRLVKDIVTGTSKGYAFVEFSDEKSTRLAVKDMTGAVLDEQQLMVDYECSRTLKGWVPRRLGGGIGGKKESGQLRFGGRHRPFKMPYSVQQSRRTFDSRARPFRGDGAGRGARGDDREFSRGARCDDREVGRGARSDDREVGRVARNDDRDFGRGARCDERGRDAKAGYRRRESEGDRSSGSRRERSSESDYRRDRDRSRDSYGGRSSRR